MWAKIAKKPDYVTGSYYEAGPSINDAKIVVPCTPKPDSGCSGPSIVVSGMCLSLT